MPLFSIIIPIYNVEKYLPKCIESVINQEFKNIEIILVDDGSPDNCSKICDEYAKKDSRIKVIHKKNGGLSDARNAGILLAKGKYLLFIDADDFIEGNSIECISKFIYQRNIDVVFLEGINYFEKQNIQVPFGVNFERNKILDKNKSDVLNHISSLDKYPGSACTLLVNRRLIIDNKLLFKKGITNEDVEWSIRVFLKANSFDYCDTKYYYYRQNREGSITDSFSVKNFKCLFDIIVSWSNLCEDSEYYIYREEIYSFIAYEYNILIAFYNRLDNVNKNEYKMKIQSYSWLMKFRTDKKSKLIKFIYNLLGLDMTSKLLNLYLKLR